MYGNAPRAVLSALAGAILLCLVLRGDGGPPERPILVWLGLAVTIVTIHLVLCRWFFAEHRPDEAWRPWAARFVIVSFFEGCMWAVGAVWMSSFHLGERQILLLTLMLAGVAAGAVPAYGSFLPALYAFIVPVFGPFVVYNAWQGGALRQALAMYFALFAAVVLLLGQYSFSKAVMQSLRDRFENVDLLNELRIEKERSEQASLDKSRFLAASSHDLRQPVHALGMFVAALRERGMDAEARGLLAHIEDCLAGLKELFDSLLDISRLDAGAIEPRPCTVPLHALLERIRLDNDPAAAAKGLSLKLVPCSAFVRTDPVLLERILRNLVDNAVRHTARGRIVIGCRRGGAAPGRLRILVCDTGPGIPREERERVFQEFVQLGNPERDRRKGLGLGLAIVRRLARLLDCELVLRSESGRGTVFDLSVPIAAGVDWKAPPTPEFVGVRLRGTVLVVDDEMAVQTAMSSLLSGWGLRVLTAGSGDEMLARTEDYATPPALLICDWRLRGDEDGIDVIERLRVRFAAEIPALLVTGDVAPGREGETQGFPLLHKPVPPGKLRAMIGAMIRA